MRIKRNNYHLYFVGLFLFGALLCVYVKSDMGTMIFGIAGVFMSAFGKKFFDKKRDN